MSSELHTDDSSRTEELAGSSSVDSPIKPEVEGPPIKKKKVALDLDDDFFSLSSFSTKKPKKKSKSKRSRSATSAEPSKHELSSEDLSILKSQGLAYEDHVKTEGQTSEETPIKSDETPVDSAYSVDLPPPPPVDKEALRRKFQKSYKRKSTATDVKLDISDDDNDFELLLQSTGIVTDDDKYNFSEENERKRMYIIKIVTKLPVPVNFNPDTVPEYGTKGTKLFSKIADAAIEGFRTQFAHQISRFEMNQYDSSRTALVWIEGKMELKPFFKPSTLRIPPPEPFDILANEVETMAPTRLSCILIPKENVVNYMTLYPEFKKTSYISDIQDEFSLQKTNEEQLHMEESSDDDVIVVDEEDTPPPPSQAELEKDQFFIIGLKGKDNKRIELQVSPETSLQKILLYYLETKDITPDSVDFKRAKLVFDDEVLDLNDKVGDTEIEEDFEIQVVI